MKIEFTYQEAFDLIKGYNEFCDLPENKEFIVIPPEGANFASNVIVNQHFRIVEAVKSLVSYLATAKQENTDEWMDRLAELINQANETLGDPDRVKYLGSNLGGWIEVCCRECGGTGAVDSGGFDPYGFPINVPCPECGP